MSISSVLIANRGEIAIRIQRAAADLGIRGVAVYSEDDERSAHVLLAGESARLEGVGPAAYLDIEQLVAIAQRLGCDAVHPGYGFLSENPAFAAACERAGITFVGPPSGILALAGDKLRAREAAEKAGVPVLPASAAATVDDAHAFFQTLPKGDSMLIKAVAGGGGRGMRLVTRAEDLAEAFARGQSEARAAFGDGSLYAERLLERARHVEVQVLGDRSGAVVHLYERDCSLQRRHQKLVEFAPAPGLPAPLRDRITSAAVALAGAIGYQNAGTFEFVLDASCPLSGETPFYFIEANARLQVEHPVTEAVTGVDIVAAQLELAGGRLLAELGLDQKHIPAPRGVSLQARVNLETMAADGSTHPAGGVLTAFEPPSGPGVRVDTYGYAGYATSPRFDSLLAKVIAHNPRPDFAGALAKARRALAEFRIEGAATNIPFLQALLAHPDVVAGGAYTRFIDDHVGELVEAASRETGGPNFQVEPIVAQPGRMAGVKVDTSDPLAVLTYGQAERRTRPSAADGPPAPTLDGTVALPAPLQGTVVSIEVAVGDMVRPGQTLVVMESMKMEHEIRAAGGGVVRRIAVAVGDTIYEGHNLLFIEPTHAEGADDAEEEAFNLDEARPDLKEVLDRRDLTRDRARPEAVARRRATHQRTARENIEHLCDPGTFVEYGPLVLAAQRARRSVEELIVKSPADGMVTGVGRINGDLFDETVSRCVVLSYDYTVFAGTQGGQNHRKTDRMIDVAENARMPLVLFAEGGGGRPGDTDGIGDAGGGSTRTFARFAQLSGLVPMIGITSGRCFAGNASLLGCCDVIIATENSNIGMGGPAMIEGGGLGVFAPEDIGGMEVQVPNGVVDLAVKDEAEAVEMARRYLAYFQGRLRTWEAPDQRLMRRIIPENRLRVYDVRRVVETLADVGTVLELRRGFGAGMVTSLVRVEGRSLGVIANNPAHLGGAIDSDAADKGARFMQLCDAFDIPILFLCDTPGIMVGPEIEKTALVRHSSRMFLIGANLQVPFFTIILRKAYGLGAIAMAGGSYKTPYFTVAWPTGEFGGMGLEGSVKLGYRAELAAIDDPEERKSTYEKMVARAYERGKALNNATYFGIDDTIDPAESRTWVASLLDSVRPPPPREGKKRPAIDAW